MSDTDGIEYGGADEAQPDLTDRFESDDGDVTLEYGNGQPDDGKKVLDADEYARIIAGSAANDKLTETVTALGQTQAQIAALLQQGEERQRAANAPKPQAELDEEKLAAELEEDILANGKAGKSVLKTAKAIANQMIGKERSRFEAAMGNIQNQLAEMQVKSVMTDPTSTVVMEKYGDEVQTVLKQMPVEQRMNPQYVKMAVNLVAGQHVMELAPLLTGNGQTAKPKATTATQPTRQTFAAKGGVGSSSSSSGGPLRIPVTREQLEADAARDFWSGSVEQYARMKYGRRS
jgi:hypothetical protein